MAAEIYFAHYFLIAVVWIIIAILIYVVALSKLISDDVVGQFLMLRVAVGSITCTFAFSIQCFFSSENREFVIVCKDVMFCCIYTLCIMMCYAHNDKLGISMTNAGIAYAVASSITAIWMFILVVRIPFLDV